MSELRGDLNEPFEGGVGDHVQVVSRKSTRYGEIGQVTAVTCFDADVAFDDADELGIPAGWLKKVIR